MKKAFVKKFIVKDFPDFVFENIKKFGEGMDSVAFLVNGSYIFRFPKDEKIRQNLAKEVATLPIIRPQLNIKIPDFEFISPEYAFVGYKIIEGEFLTKELFYSFSKIEQDSIQKVIAKFLVTIHQQNIKEFIKCGIVIQDFRAEYRSDFENVRKYIFPIISDENKQFITKLFNQYLENKENFLYQPMLLHNDLGTDHILIDPLIRQLNGIIDFGDIGIGDPDYDLMYLMDDFGEGFVQSFLEFYPHPNHQKLFAKLNFWLLVDDLQAVVHFLEENNYEKVEEYKPYFLNRINEMKSKGF